MTPHRTLPIIGAATLAWLLLPAVARAHGEEAPAPVLPDVLFAWSLDPVPLIGIGVAALAYLRAVREVNAAHPRAPVSRWRVASFLGGLVAILVALLSPIDLYEGMLISVHMVQHMLLQFVAPPLLLLGTPVTLALRVATPGVRASLLRVLHSRVIRLVTHPLLAWTLFVGVSWGWQFSPLYDLALESTLIHYLQHGVYLATALLFWWPIVAADPAPEKLAYPGRAAYVALAIPQNSFLGITLMNVQPELYPHYWTQLRTWGPPLVEDLRIAGAIMWGMGAMVFAAALLLVVAAWLRTEERRTARREARPEVRRAAAEAAEAYRRETSRRRPSTRRPGRSGPSTRHVSDR